jgi:membrane-bound metal-dependent hydrolase YbcI (DUF457 family)
MLGHSHALSGLAVGAATLPAAPVQGAAMQVAWVAAWGGFAMLPDLDQHGATIARMWGPVTSAVARAVGAVAGGHRKGTHSVLGLFAFYVVALLANLHPAGQLTLLALAIGLALRACHFVIPGSTETTVLGNVALSWGGAWWIISQGHASPTWLPLALVGGAAVHVVGDLVTTSGVPLAYPLKGRQSLGLFRTGATVETAFLAPVFCLVAAYLLWTHTGADLLAPVLTDLRGPSA